jgi:serine/threonine protein kinase
VLKEVPSVARVMARLKSKFPDATTDLLEKRALKFTEKIFPLFLTREAAILQILERDQPPAHARRIPRVVGMDKDARGYVRRLKMSWLRVGSPRPLSQLEFAKQAFDLLQVVHERVGVIHLDLRLDNMVVTDHGVGFVDFGSAVRVGENIQGNPLLANLYDELMRTSQIQRMIEKMTLSGAVTSHLIQSAFGRVDKQVDLFYLAMQMVQPLNNPDFRGLVEFDPTSREAEALSALKEQVLKPADPQNPVYRSAPDVLRAILRIEQDLKGRPTRRVIYEAAPLAR